MSNSRRVFKNLACPGLVRDLGVGLQVADRGAPWSSAGAAEPRSSAGRPRLPAAAPTPAPPGQPGDPRQDHLRRGSRRIRRARPRPTTLTSTTCRPTRGKPALYLPQFVPLSDYSPPSNRPVRTTSNRHPPAAFSSKNGRRRSRRRPPLPCRINGVGYDLLNPSLRTREVNSASLRQEHTALIQFRKEQTVGEQRSAGCAVRVWLLG